jgi:hypothetical protein
MYTTTPHHPISHHLLHTPMYYYHRTTLYHTTYSILLCTLLHRTTLYHTTYSILLCTTITAPPCITPLTPYSYVLLSPHHPVSHHCSPRPHISPRSSILHACNKMHRHKLVSLCGNNTEENRAR